MTRVEAVRNCLHQVLDMAEDEQTARFILEFARNDTTDNGDLLYSLWCDDQGACKGRDCEVLEDCCSDEEHTACILRYLQGEYTECL